MTIKSLLLAGTLAAASLSLASAKSYDISLDQPTIVGQAKLAPGHYRVAVKGSDAVFTNLDSNKTFTEPVKVSAANRKYGETSAETLKENDGEHLQDIRLGGSRTRLVFN